MVGVGIVVLEGYESLIYLYFTIDSGFWTVMGAWAGPLVFAALFFNKTIKIPDGVFIRDSKALNRSQRVRCEIFLRENSTFCITAVSGGTIDKYGIQGATILCLKKVCLKIKKKIMKNFRISEETYLKHYRLLIDGRRVVRIAYPHQYIVCGDDKVPVISAASIVAKVYRDSTWSGCAENFLDMDLRSMLATGQRTIANSLSDSGSVPFIVRYMRQLSYAQAGILEMCYY